MVDALGTARRAITEIAAWDLDASREDNKRYFYSYPGISKVVSGERALVTGRKGAGKTAVFEFIRLQQQHDLFVKPLRFSNYSFEILYKCRDIRFRGAAQYMTFWKFIIYSNICALIIRDQSVSASPITLLERAFPQFTDEKIRQFIPNTKSDSLSFEIPDIIKISTSSPVEASVEWVGAVDALESFLYEVDAFNRYFVLFDALDDDFHGIVSRGPDGAVVVSADYLDLIAGLIRALYEIKSKFTQKDAAGRHIFNPVVFLSSDVLDLISDRDKNKWNSIKLDLKWGRSEIRDFLAFRISRAVDPSGDILPIDAAWTSVFTSKKVRIKRGKTRSDLSTFDYMLRKTLLRPRDFVAFLRLIAQHNEVWGHGFLGPRDILYAEMDYSKYFRQEFIDELGTILPDINIYFDVMSEIKKTTFLIAEFEQVLSRHLQEKITKSPLEYTPTRVLRYLYEYDVIGYYDKGSRTRVFRYRSPYETFSPTYPLMPHSGLYRVLGITRPPTGPITRNRPQDGAEGDDSDFFEEHPEDG